MVCILFVLQLQRYKIILDFCYILQSFLYSILHFITLLQRVGNFSYMYIEIAYSIKNISKAPLYIPFKTWSDDSTFSSMSVFLINGKDTIVPLYRIKKCPYNSDLVNVGDSMLLWIKLYGFNRWQNKDYNINTNVQDIVKAIKLIYNRDARDKKVPHKTPALIFDSVPINNRYFERPSSSGEDIL